MVRSRSLGTVPVGTTITAGKEGFRVTKEDLRDFAEKWDPMPIHVDDAAARAAGIGLRERSCPGALVHAISIRLRHDDLRFGITAIEGKDAQTGFGGDDDGLVRVEKPVAALQKNMKLLKPVYSGDTLRLRGTVLGSRSSKKYPGSAIVTVRFDMFNQHGEVVYEEEDTVMATVPPEAKL
jgi:acyl dehydratase